MVTDCYVDGGIIRVNPSPIGGTWAWCHVDDRGERVREDSGVVLPGERDHPALITNNFTEFVAMTLGLEALPAGWEGTVHADSRITLGRFFEGYKITHIPPSWARRGLAARRRLGPGVRWVLLDGHPTREQLAAGVGKRGHPVSIYNRWCDEACRAAAWDAAPGMNLPPAALLAEAMGGAA